MFKGTDKLDLSPSVSIRKNSCTSLALNLCRAKRPNVRHIKFGVIHVQGGLTNEIYPLLFLSGKNLMQIIGPELV